MMTEQIKDNRTRYRGVRFTEKEEILLEKRMKAAGYLSASRFIRDCVLGRDISVPKKVRLTDRGLRDQLNAINAEIQKIGVNYNQVAKQVNSYMTHVRESGKTENFVMALRSCDEKLLKETKKLVELMNLAVDVIEKSEDKINDRLNADAEN